MPGETGMRPARLIHNPNAGGWKRGRLLSQLVEELSSDGSEIEVVATSRPGEASELARRAAVEGAPIVFSLGGDGTAREVAAGLLGSSSVLGVLPGGTTNVICRALGLPREPLAAARVLKRAPARPMDVGLCGDDVFLMQASMGLDGAALSATQPLLKRIMGRGAVGLAALGSWWKYDYPEFEILIDGFPITATFVAVCNLALYGGSLELVPTARPDDSQLDVLLFQGVGRRAMLSFGRDLFAGRHLDRKDVQVIRASEVVVTDPDVPLQVDGDVVPNRLGVEIRLAEDCLRVLAP